NACVLKVGVPLDLEQIPAQIVQFQHGEEVRLSGHARLDVSRILVEVLFGAGFDLRDDRESVAGRCFGINGAIAALLDLVLEQASLRGGLSRGFRPVLTLLPLFSLLLPGTTRREAVSVGCQRDKRSTRLRKRLLCANAQEPPFESTEQGWRLRR